MISFLGLISEKLTIIISCNHQNGAFTAVLIGFNFINSSNQGRSGEDRKTIPSSNHLFHMHEMADIHINITLHIDSITYSFYYRHYDVDPLWIEVLRTQGLPQVSNGMSEVDLL